MALCIRWMFHQLPRIGLKRRSVSPSVENLYANEIQQLGPYLGKLYYPLAIGVPAVKLKVTWLARLRPTLARYQCTPQSVSGHPIR